MKITDNKTYYERTGTEKGKFVFDFIEKNNKINKIFDVGCNNGEISYPLQKKLNKSVFGIGLSNDLIHPIDYDFTMEDIVNSKNIRLNDCTLFLSLYHHILGKYGLDVADDVFYRLLLRTDYLIFDSGNLSELSRRNTHWYGQMKKHFNNEYELLNHFGIKYEIIGKWDVASGSRSVVVFYKNDFDDAVINLKKYKRKGGSKYIIDGLFDYSEKIDNEYLGVCFHKLKLNNKIFFTKKHNNNKKNHKELENIILLYKSLDGNKLIKFYGYSNKFGLVFEWINHFNWIKKTKLDLGDINLVDVDVIIIDGEEKYIDFER